MPSHDIPALSLLAGPPSLMSTLGCSASCLALLPGHGSIKSDPRTTPSFISFLADSFSSRSTHNHSPSGARRATGPTPVNLSIIHNNMNTASSVGERIWQTRPDQVSRSPQLDSKAESPLALSGAVKWIWLCPPWPDPVGLHPSAEGTAHAVAVLILQLVHPCNATTSPCCALAALPWAGCVSLQLWNTHGTRRAWDQLRASFCFTCLPSYWQKRKVSQPQ